MKISCIAVDDEPRALEIIEDYINQVPFLSLAGSFRNPLKAFEHIKTHAPDLLFLDINMPNLSGIEFIKALKNRPLIILTTAYSEYAIESYGLDVLDYLLKPIEFNRFFSAANKAFDQMTLIHGIEDSVSTEVENTTDFVFVKDGNQLVRIELNDILYIEASGNYQVIFLKNSKMLSLITMDELLKSFKSDHFLRVHKSYAVNIKMIDSIENHRISIGEKDIPISDTYKAIFYNAL